MDTDVLFCGTTNQLDLSSLIITFFFSLDQPIRISQFDHSIASNRIQSPTNPRAEVESIEDWRENKSLLCFQFTGLHTINLEKQEKKKTPVSARDQTTNHYACRVGKCPLWYFTFHLNSPNLKQNQKQDVKACSVAEHQNFKRIANFSTLPWINTNKQRKQSILKFIPLFLKRVVISSTRLISKKFPHFLSFLILQLLKDYTFGWASLA